MLTTKQVNYGKRLSIYLLITNILVQDEKILKSMIEKITNITNFNSE